MIRKALPFYDVPAGEQIPGSRLYRAYCQRCGAAFRVSLQNVYELTPTQKMKPSKTLKEQWCRDCSPWRFNRKWKPSQPS